MVLSREEVRVVLHSRSLGSFTIRESERVGPVDLKNLVDSLIHRDARDGDERLRCILEDGSVVWFDPDVVEWAEIFCGHDELAPESFVPGYGKLEV